MLRCYRIREIVHHLWRKNNEGMVTRTIRYLFQQRQAREGSAEIQFVVSFLELYLDNTYDLLDDKPPVQSSTMGSFGSTRQLVEPDASSAGAEPSIVSNATPAKQQDSKILQLRETTTGAVYAEGFLLIQFLQQMLCLHCLKRYQSKSNVCNGSK